jgi:hypothetical protein
MKNVYSVAETAVLPCGMLYNAIVKLRRQGK